MIKDTFIKPDRETKLETKGGNYFVSNYPPFSFWNEEDLPWAFIITFPSAGSVVISVTLESTPTKIQVTSADTCLQP